MSDPTLDAFPLSWPAGRPRTPAARRKRARFGTRTRDDGGHQKSYQVTNYGGLSRVREQLAMLRAADIVISTNLPVRQDGLPYSKVREPDDPGVAVYFRIEGSATCLACDRWDKVADNLAAIAAHVEAIRGQARWGVGSLAQAFAGYKALPAMGEVTPWWTRLGFKEPPETAADVKAKWLTLASTHHPDKGGNQSQAAEINAAWGEAQRFYEQEATR